MIFASPKRSYAGTTCEPQERLAILDTAQVGCQVVIGCDVLPVCRMVSEIVDVTEREKSGNNQGARTAQSTLARQVACENNVCSAQGTCKIVGDATRHGSRIRAPVVCSRVKVAGKSKLALLPGSGICDSNRSITARAHDDAKTAFDGAKQAAPACVVRMFAKNLDASWYVETRLAE